jgi:gag-polypeptide of LTR copia-type
MSLSQSEDSPSTGAVTPSLASLRPPYVISPLENDGNNYTFWKHRTQRFFKLWKLWNIVNGDLTMPGPSASPDERAEWLYKDEEARGQIRLTLDDKPLDYIRDARTAKECWDKLSVWYKNKWTPRIPLLLAKVFRSTLSDNEPLGPQIDALIRAARIIESLGLALDDKLVAFSIISSLPSSLSTLKTIMLVTTELSELSPENVWSRVVFDERRRVLNSGVLRQSG